MKAITDKDEAAIQAAIAGDADAPEATAQQLAQVRTFAEAFPALAASANRGGRPPLDVRKQAVSIRLDPEVIAHFKAGGPGWQSRINDALRDKAGLT